MPNSECSVVPLAEYTKKRKAENLVKCRTCQEDGEVSSMEIPCYCCGSMKGVLDGKYDALLEQSFYMVGGIEEVIAKAEKIAKEFAA